MGPVRGCFLLGIGLVWRTPSPMRRMELFPGFVEVFLCPICIANSRRFVAIPREDSEMSSGAGFIAFLVATF